MGLDGVELVLEVEDVFVIHLSDAEAERAHTVGDLHQLILSKLGPPDAPRCLTSTAFHRTRRALIAALGVARRTVRPDTPLAQLLPPAGRRRAWRQVRAALGLRLPSLEHPPWLQNVLLATGQAGAVAVWFARDGSLGSLPLAVLLGIASIGPLMLLALPLATAFPHHSATVGDLARVVLERNHGRLAQRKGGAAPSEVWDTLRGIVSRQLDVAPERVTPQARFVADLGLR